jgi:transcriptional regulator with XRE-family HTH domain
MAAASANRNSSLKTKASGVANPKSLARLFRDKRAELGLDLGSIAIDAAVSIATVRRLEKEPQRVPLQDLYAVANVLNLEPGDVLELLHSAMR